MPLSFIEHLETQLKEAAPKQKGERTRLRLKIATAKILEEKGYHALRVSDVTDAAEVAEGSFYVYFRDKKDASLDVLTSMMEDFVNLDEMPESARPWSRFASIRATNRRWLALCRANSGLMRCIFQLGDEEPDFARLVQRSNRLWYERVARSMQRRDRGIGRDAALLVIYFLGAMMDEIVRKLIVYPDPEFHKVLKALRADDDAVADAASIVWMRVFDSEAQFSDDLTPAASELAKWMRRG